MLKISHKKPIIIAFIIATVAVGGSFVVSRINNRGNSLESDNNTNTTTTETNNSSRNFPGTNIENQQIKLLSGGQYLHEKYKLTKKITWRNFVLDKGKFQVIMPEQLVTYTKTRYLNNEDYFIYAFASPDYTYLNKYEIAYTIVPDNVDISDIQKALDGSVNGFVEAWATDNSKLISSNNATYGGYPAADMVLKTDKHPIIIARSILVGRRFYLLEVEANLVNRKINQSDLKKFMNSFKVLKQ